MKKINENFQNITELIRKVNSLIAPITVHNDFKWLMDKKNNDKFRELHPKCVLPINMGRTIIYAPVCNRLGAEDPEMIRIAHKFVCKLSGHEKMHALRGEMHIVQLKLEKLMRKFDKDIPKPTDMAAKKAGSTIALNKIKAYNDTLKGI